MNRAEIKGQTGRFLGQKHDQAIGSDPSGRERFAFYLHPVPGLRTVDQNRPPGRSAGGEVARPVESAGVKLPLPLEPQDRIGREVPTGQINDPGLGQGLPQGLGGDRESGYKNAYDQK